MLDAARAAPTDPGVYLMRDGAGTILYIGKAKHLLIQPTFKDEKPTDLDFALSGLAPAIATVVKHSVAANQKLVAQTPGA